MKDYAKLVKTPQRELRQAEKAQPQEQPDLVRSAKELQSKEQQGSKNTFAILLVIFIVIVVGYGIVHQYLATHHIDFSSGHISKANAPSKKNSTSTTQNNVPQFDFYTVLPKGNTPTASNNENNNQQQNAPAPTTPVAPPPAAPQPATAPPSPPPAPSGAPVTTINVSSTKYYLNTGDYANSDDAQKMLSQLLLLGVQASISPKNDNGATVYEVLAGPFPDQATLSVVKNQLNSHQINSVTIQ